MYNNLQTAKQIKSDLEFLIKNEKYPDVRNVRDIYDRYQFRRDSQLVKDEYSSGTIFNFELYIDEINNYIEKYTEIEIKQQNELGITNSIIDELIYENYQEYISIAPLIFGNLSLNEIEHKRKLIIKSIKQWQRINQIKK